MISEKTTREDFLKSSLKDISSAENMLKKIYARVPYICNLSSNSGNVDDCKRVLGLKVNRDEISELNRELQYLRLSIDSSVLRMTSLRSSAKKTDENHISKDEYTIKTLRIASSRILDYSKYTALQAGMSEVESDTSHSFLLKTNQEYGINELFKLLNDQAASIRSELCDMENEKSFVMRLPCGIKDSIDKAQTCYFLKQVIVSSEPSVEGSLSIPYKQPYGFLEIHFTSKDSAEKARAAIIMSFKQTQSASIEILNANELGKNNRYCHEDFSL